MGLATSDHPHALSYDQEQVETYKKIVDALSKAAPGARAMIARQQLSARYPALIQAFETIVARKQVNTVLFISVHPHVRETRLAATARLAGWQPVLVHLGDPKYNPADFFSFHQKCENLPALVLATWLFPGPLQHIFSLRGDQAYALAALKNTPTVVDLYDTCTGMSSVPSSCHALERETLRLADGITHRDLRVRYLEKYYGYEVPSKGVLLHDPLGKLPADLPKRDRDGEIRVVSTGWIGSGDSSAVRVIGALCAGGVHVHVYFNPLQNPNDPSLAEYARLARESSYFHIEEQVYGDEYWRQLSRYDYGLSINERDLFQEPFTDYTRDYIAGCGSSRLMDYIQRGLGVIISPALRFQALLARHHASTMVEATREFLKNPRPALSAGLERSRERPLDSITVKAAAKRLRPFYRAVARGGAQ